MNESQHVIACITCGEVEGLGMMVYPDGWTPGPLYHCWRCSRWQGGVSRCEQCGRFGKRVAAVSCPMQDESPDERHDADWQDLYECADCDRRGVELCWFDAAQMAAHLADPTVHPPQQRGAAQEQTP